METKENKTRVIFRVFADGEVIALFPHIKENNGMIGSYMHLGQHSEAHPAIIYDTKLATPEQYGELFAELQSIGYNLEVGKKVSKCPMRYQDKKAAARDEAIDWQYWQVEQNLSYGEFAEWGNYFENLGRRYGLLREFRENGII